MIELLDVVDVGKQIMLKEANAIINYNQSIFKNAKSHNVMCGTKDSVLWIIRAFLV